MGSVRYNCVLCCEVSSIRPEESRLKGLFHIEKSTTLTRKVHIADRIENIIEKTRENKGCDFKSILSSHPAVSQNKKNHDHQRISGHPSYDGRGVPNSAIIQCG